MNKPKTASKDRRLKRQIPSFNAPEDQQDNLCEEHKEEILERTREIEQGWETREIPIIHESQDRKFTRKEFKIALKPLSTKLTNAPDKDGIWIWMLFTSGEVM